MQRYILKRVLQAIFTILIVVVAVFFLMRITGDPVMLMVPPDADEELVATYKEKYGLDKPIMVQFGNFLLSAVKGDLGTSFKWQEPALSLVLNKFPATLELAVVAALLAWGIGIPIGVISAVRRDTLLDRFGKTFSLLGQATPSFWLGIMLILVVGVELRWLPVSGRAGPSSVIMPAVTISFIMLAATARLSRSAMLDALNSEYVSLARIKGLQNSKVIMVHAFKNSLIPVLTLMSLQFSRLLMGAVVAETIFAWPGIGKLALDAVFARDFPVVQTVVLFSAVLFCFANILVDVLYAYIDPRIRYR